MSIPGAANGWNMRRQAVHPGEMLREEYLVPLALSANRLAIELRIPVTRITEILHERRAITAGFWLGLQKDYELQTARQSAGEEIARDIKPHRQTAA